MAKFEDYLPVSAGTPEGGLEGEINDAANQQETRQDPAATPTDWQTRYVELEKLNSRQAQTLGEYRKTIDDFIVNPTPEGQANAQQEPPEKFSLDGFYENPESELNRAIDSHPAIQEARQVVAQAETDSRQRDFDAFAKKHPDYSTVGGSPEFQNWVMDSPTRMDLFQRGDNYDFNAADALFSLYTAEKGLTQVTNQQEIAQAELVSSSGELAPAETPQYSRSEYIHKLTRARQGDLVAEDWVKTHAANYRTALTNGNVRD